MTAKGMTKSLGSIQIIRQADLHPEPWKNGGGITRQICSETAEEGLLWRLSLADVSSDGAFSTFPNMMRVLTVVQGAGIDLYGADTALVAAPFKPLRFDGAMSLDGVLRDGKIVNFNLIHHAQHIRSDVTVLHGPSPVIPLTSGALHVLHCASGEITMNRSKTLAMGDTAIIPANEAMPETEGSGICILLALKDQREASSPFIAPR
jgi:environmental stress-induced protein Ves